MDVTLRIGWQREHGNLAKDSAKIIQWCVGEAFSEEASATLESLLEENKAAATELHLKDTQSVSNALSRCLPEMAQGASCSIQANSKVSPSTDESKCDSDNAPCNLWVELKQMEVAKWDLSPTERLALAERKRQMGSSHFRCSRDEKALTLYRAALDLIEFDEDFEEHSDLDEENESEKVAFPPIAEVHAERFKCFSNLAAVSLRIKDFDLTKTTSWCHRALQIDSKDARVWYRKGCAERELGDIKGAVKSFKEAAKLAPKDAAIRAALSEVEVAQKEEGQTLTGGYATRYASALWGDASIERAATEPKPKAKPIDPADAEHNRRELLHHMEKARVPNDPEEET